MKFSEEDKVFFLLKIEIDDVVIEKFAFVQTD